MSRGWWRRNAVALVAVAALLPVTAGVIAGNEWWARNQSEPVFATTAQPGQEIDYAGATWGPAAATITAPGPDDDVPSGTRLVVVEVPVAPDAEGIGCLRPTLRELSGERRQWNDATSHVDWDYELDTFCDSESTGSFTLSLPFLLPDDAEGPFGVDIQVGDELPGFLRLVVAP